MTNWERITMTRGKKLLVVVLLGLGTGLALGGWGKLCLYASMVAGQSAGRDFVEVDFEVLFETPVLFDSPLLSPGMLAADSTGSLFIFDYGDMALKKISPDGELAWSFGRRGQGPGEFVGASGLSVVEGQVWVVDPENSRMTWVSLDGRDSGSIPFPEATRGIQVDGYHAIALNLSAGPLLKAYDSTGAVVEEFSPKDFSEGATSMVREAYISGGRLTKNFMVMFLHAGYLVHGLSTDQGIALRMIEGIEPLPFPEMVSRAVDGGFTVIRVDPAAPDAGRWLDHDSQYFYVGFNGTSGREGLVDLYGTATGAYEGSFQLPADVRYGAVVTNGVIAGLIHDPVPQIKVWRVRWLGDG